MKRFFLALGLLLCSIIVLGAAPVTQTQAERAAQNFFAKRQPHSSLSASTCRMDFVYRTADSGQALFYVFNRGANEGFVLISADDRFPVVIGYAFEGRFDATRMPDNLKGWLRGYEREMTAVMEGRATAINATEEAVPTRNLPTSVAPILETGVNAADPIIWDQGYPFNTLHPILESGQQAYTGCVATAMAQIMRHYKWPASATGGYDYYDNLLGGPNTHYSGTFGTTYDWVNMPGTVSSDVTNAQVTALSTFMRDVTFSVNMQFADFGSGTFSIYVGRALRDNFHYKHSLRYLDRALVPTPEWKALIRQELAEQRPVYYSGSDGEMGHAFVCDGYEADGTFHFNWGWGGLSNGNFYLNLLNPGSLGTGAGNGGYSTNQEIVVGIEPAYNGETGTMPDPTIALLNLHHTTTDEAFDFEVTIRNFSNYVGDVNLAYRLTKPDGTQSIVPAASVGIVWEDLVGESTATVSVPRNQLAEGKNVIAILYRTEGMAEWQELHHLMMWWVNHIEISMPNGEVTYTKADARIALKEGSLSYNLKAFSDGTLKATLYNPGTEEYRSRVTYALRNAEGRLYYLGRRLMELAPGDPVGENIVLKVENLKARAGQYTLVCTGDMNTMLEDASWVELATVEVQPHSSSYSPILVAANEQLSLLTVHRTAPEALPAFSVTNEGNGFNGSLAIFITSASTGKSFIAKELSISISKGETRTIAPDLTASAALYTDTNLYPDGVYYVHIAEKEPWEVTDLFGDYYYRMRLVTDMSDHTVDGAGSTTLKLFPNPADTFVQVSIPSLYVGETLRIFDIQGRMHLHTIVSNETLRLDLTQFAKGSYLITVGDLTGKLYIR